MRLTQTEFDNSDQTTFKQPAERVCSRSSVMSVLGLILNIKELTDLAEHVLDND